MNHEIFIPFIDDTIGLYNKSGPFGRGMGGFISQEFWNWAEQVLEQQGDRRGPCWQVLPDTREVNGVFEHGRVFRFEDVRDMVLFKLTWLGSI